MARLVIFYSLALALSAVPIGLAGPACAHKHYQAANCVEKCKAKWGWTGSMMSVDRWGSVINKVEKSPEAWEEVIAKACGSSASQIPSATGSSGAGTPTFISQPGPVIGAGSDPAQTAATSSVPSPIIVTSSTASLSIVSSSTSTAISKSQTAAASSSTRFIISIRPSPPATTKKSVTTQIPATTQRAPPTTTPSTDNGSGSGSGSDSTSSSDIQAYLSAHNSVRASHGASALVWSDELAGKAQQWANNCRFQHSGGSLGPYGENLAAGTGSSYGISDGIKSWTDEVSDYNANNPVPSHFTQVVWKGSQQLGCAVQECDGIFPAQYGKSRYYVCEYFPAGNVIGQFA
ncbi:Protein PRY2 [Leucoagaricus sp. SymC.cos]|nr:Protein PRY2 [Leucoagaricus sp. SymC.cos]